MKQIKIIIGANYGDEGKGFAANYFSKTAKAQNKSTVVVLHNGGFQRGHTVFEGDKRHVFHAFSSGTFQGASTYYASTFILNPMFFREEYETLKNMGFEPKVFASPKCRITCPYDIMINQIVEDYRNQNRHSSCGYGIFETVKRDIVLPFSLEQIIDSKNIDGYVFDFMNEYRKTYLTERLDFYGVKSIPVNMLNHILNDEIIYKFIEDFKFMASKISIREPQFIDEFDYIIFEGSQGLMLDNDRPVNKDFLTPSKTGIYNPAQMIKELKYMGFLQNTEIETCYITRTYFTRHGNGDFPQECKKEEINPDMVDLTNMPNHYQGTLRYGFFDINEIAERIKEDSLGLKDSNPCLFVTHLNETNGCFIEKQRKIPVNETKLVKYCFDKEQV